MLLLLLLRGIGIWWGLLGQEDCISCAWGHGIVRVLGLRSLLFFRVAGWRVEKGEKKKQKKNKG